MNRQKNAGEGSAYARGFMAGFDKALAFMRNETATLPAHVRDLAVEKFLIQNYRLGGNGRRQASVIYHEFLAWQTENDPASPPVTQTAFGKKLARLIPKKRIKSNGRQFYRGLKPVDDSSDRVQTIPARHSR